MSEFFSIVVSDQASLWGLNVIIHTTVLTAVSLLIAVLFRRAAAMRYWVLCFGLVLVLVSPGISALIQATGSSWLTVSIAPVTDSVVESTPVKPDVSRSVVDDVHSQPILPADTFAMQPTPPYVEPPEREAISVAPISIQTPMTASAVSTRPAEWQKDSLRFVVLPLILVWTFVAAVRLLRMLVGWIRMSRILNAATPIDDERFQAAFDRACITAGCLGERRPKLVVSDCVSGPIAAGVLRGKVVLPASLLKQVDPQSLADVLVHEVAHVVRRDQIVVLLQNFVSAIYWPHPLVRKLNRELAKAREEVCDNFVLSATETPVYSRTLLSLAELVQQPKAMHGSVGFFTDRWKLENRISGLLDAQRNRTTFLSKRGWLFVTASTLGLSALMCVGTITIATAQVDDELSVEEPVGSENLKVRGVVLKPDGSPASGATVRTAAPVYAGMRGLLGERFETAMTEVVADEQGRFEISIDTKPYGDMPVVGTKWEDYWKLTVISATLPGFAGQFTKFKDVERFDTVTLKLVNNASIHGRVIDLEGRPVRGVTFEVKDVRAAKNESLNEWLQDVKKGEPAWVAVNQIPRECETRMLDVPDFVTSDENGKLEIKGLGPERYIRLHVHGNGIALEDFRVVSRPMEPLQWNSVGRPDSPSVVYGTDFTLTGRPSRTVSGTLTDAETGMPLVGVDVAATMMSGRNLGGFWLLPTKTDELGKFRIDGLPKGEGNRLMIRPTDEQPYFMQEIDVPSPDGIDAIAMEIEMHRGIWIEGTVVDKQTRDPVAGVRVHYLPHLTNKFANELPEFDRGNVEGQQDRYQTDADGKYRLVGLPGPAIIGFESTHKPYRTVLGYKELTAPKDKYGQVQTYRNPINPSRKWPHSMVEINPDTGTQAVQLDAELEPKRTSGNSAAFVSTDGDSGSNKKSSIQPTANLRFVGRVNDEAGKPIEGAELRFIGMEVGKPASLSDLLATTNANGEFTFEHAMPSSEQSELHKSVKYAKLVSSKPQYGSSVIYAARCETSGVLASLLTDQEKKYMFGDDNVEKSSTITMPPDQQRVRGRILNTDGQPVVGAKVAAINVYEGKAGSLDDWREETQRSGAN